MTLAERNPASYPYPSPASETHNQPLPSPHQPYAHPSLHRSDSMPGHMHIRPDMPRNMSTPASGEFMISNAVGMARPTDWRNEEEEREELTTKGRKRKRLAKACSACNVRLSPPPQPSRGSVHLADDRKTSVDATVSPLVPTANSPRDPACMSTRKAKSSHPLGPVIPSRRNLPERLRNPTASFPAVRRLRKGTARPLHRLTIAHHAKIPEA